MYKGLVWVYKAFVKGGRLPVSYGKRVIQAHYTIGFGLLIANEEMKSLMFVKTEYRFEMNRFLLAFLLFATLSIKAGAQQTFFVYIESEAREPFYVLIDGKINYSSSINGFLTIPQMPNGVYDAEIGFVRGKYPEQHFTLSIKNQDLGYTLRRSKENTFDLMNLQTFATIAPLQSIEKPLASRVPSLDIDTTPPLTNKLKQSPKCIIATDEDYKLLHKQMEQATTEEGMIATAEATFAQRCFSTEEIKNLSKLIPSDKNKLAFFLAARQSIYDGNNFGTLEGQLSDPIIKKQFRNTL